MTRKRTGLLLICLLILVAIPAAVTAAEFSVTTDKTVDVPDRTVTQAGETFQLDSITKVDPNDQITVSVTAPSDTDFKLYLYNNNQAIIKAFEDFGASLSISPNKIGASESGTYAFVVQSDGVNEAGHAMVVRGYSVSVDSVSSVTAGENISVNGRFTKLKKKPYERLEVVVAATDTDEQIRGKPDVDKTNSSFSASISTETLSAGSYDVYVIIRGSEKALGENEILGFSDPQLLQIKNNDSGDDTGDSSDGSSDGGDGSSGSSDGGDGSSGSSDGGDGSSGSSDGGDGSSGSSDSGDGSGGGGASSGRDTDTSGETGDDSGGGDDGGSSDSGASGDATDSTPADNTRENKNPVIPEQASLEDGPVTRSIADAKPDQSGVSVPVNAGPVGQLTFEDTGVESAGEVTVSQSSATIERFHSRFGAERVKTAVSITVPESLRDTAATIQLSLGETDLGDTAPTELQVVKRTGGGSQVLSSRVERTADGGVVITARTPGFSEFAVVAAEPDPEPDTSATETETRDDETAGTESTVITQSSDEFETESLEGETPGFGVGIALVALVAAVIGVRYRAD